VNWKKLQWILLISKTEGETGGTRRLWQGLKIPQGLNKATFKDISNKLRSSVSFISDDIVVQGSRSAHILWVINIQNVTVSRPGLSPSRINVSAR
jgi:hypothetical protein